MERLLKGCCAAALILLFVAQDACLAASSGKAGEAEFQSVTQSMLDAIAPGDRHVWEQRLHPDFVRLDENGDATAGPAFLEALKPLPAGLEGRMEIEDFSVAIEGDVAVATYSIQEYLDYFGQPLRSRFRSMDTWVKTPGGWRLLGQHVAAELKDPPAISVPNEILCAYEGVYELTPKISTTMSCAEDGLLAVREGRPDAAYLAETAAVFFVAGRPRTRRIFKKNPDNTVIGFVDRREGEDVLWKRRGINDDQ